MYGLLTALADFFRFALSLMLSDILEFVSLSTPMSVSIPGSLCSFGVVLNLSANLCAYLDFCRSENHSFYPSGVFLTKDP